MEAFIPLIVQLLGGAAGGNLLGTILRAISLGGLGNTIAGAIGGALGGQLLGPILGPMITGGAAVDAAAGIDPMALLSEAASGGIGGAGTVVLAGLLKRMFAS